MDTKTVVLKLGTHVLTHDSHTLNRDTIDGVAREVAALQKKGHNVVVVSSGAVAAGAESLDTTVTDRNVQAAVGQVKLMEAYEEAFRAHGTTVAQILLTRADFRDRTRYKNARNTLLTLVNHNIIPIINENDVVSTYELSFGDNDSLAAYTAIALEASHLLFMTNQEGLLDADPTTNPDAQLIEEVTNADEIYKAVSTKNTKSDLGFGGIVSKVKAAQLAASAGITVSIANGLNTDNVSALVSGEKIGTRFVPQSSSPSPRERWMLCANNAGAQVYIDPGATTALCSRKSLLVVGVRKVSGDFEAKNIVEIRSTDGSVVGYGIVNYSADEIREAVESSKTLEREVIHTNNLRLLHNVCK